MTDVDIQTVRNWPKPQCSKDVERFAGLANYHRGFVKDFSRLAAPLYQVVGKYKFQWGSEQERAFTALKDALTNPPVLALPNQCDAFVLDTDASPRTSTIVQFIFYLWSFEISVNFLRNRK